MLCILCTIEIKPKGFSNHIMAKHNMTSQEYYDKFLKKPGEGQCVVDNKPTKYAGILVGYSKHCCDKCAQLDPLVKAKKAQTCTERFGTENPYQSKEVKAKITQTNLDKFGVGSVLQLDSVRKKTYKAVGSSEIIQKIHDTRATKIAQFEAEHDCTHKVKLVQLYGQGWLKLGLDELILDDHAHFIKNSDVPKIVDCVRNSGSKFEYEVRSFIQSVYNGKLLFNTRSVINPLELDVYLPDLNIAIECNGLYWHSSLNNVDKEYHQNKSMICQNKGIRLIHIYESEWYNNQEYIQNILKDALKYKIDTKCIFTARPIDNDIYEISINEMNSASNEIGVQFVQFLNTHKPKKLVAYSDFNKFDGKSYEKLGMHCTGCTEPNSWLVVDNTLILSKDIKDEQLARAITYGAGYKKYERTI